MFTRDERRALLFLAAVAVAGAVMRVARAAAGGTAPGAPVVAPELASGDVARQAGLARRALELARPLRPGERVDVDRASAEELERLPRVGPALARRIVDDRATHGPFGSLPTLGRVPGIGPGMLKGLEHSATFSGVPRPDGPRAASPAPGTGAAVVPRECGAAPLDLNRAGAAELACLPGIGPTLADRIVTWRTEHGPFRQVQDLERVPGIGATRRARLAPLLSVS